MYRAAFILTIIGAVVLVIAIVLPLVFPMLFESKLTKKLIIRPDTEMEKNFRETPVPIYFQLYFFNLTNAEEVSAGAKPVLKQLGPYTYRQRRQRLHVHWNDDLGTVLFKSRKFYYFEPESSYGPESDMITTINPVYISLTSRVSASNVPDIVKSVAELWFTRFNNTLFMTHSVKELSFRGYDEPLLEELFKLSKDPTHERGRSGFFYNKNGTLDGEVEIFSGELGMTNYQHIVKYHGDEMLGYWKEDRCNQINGTDGAQFARPIDKSKPLYLFTAQLCRSIYATYEKDVKLGPLNLHRFVLPRSLLDNSDENKCYCNNNFTCRAGMIDISACRKKVPVVISTPHFYQGDTEDQLAVDGLNPLKEEHETFLDIEPTTGVTMRVAKRIQLNMPLRRYGAFPALSKVPELILPILWINESVVVPMDRVNKLHTTLTFPVKLVTYGSWLLLAIGLILIFIAALLTFSTYRKSQASKKKRQQQTDIKLDDKNVSFIRKNKTSAPP